MKTIIAGSRLINCPHLVAQAYEQAGWEVTEVVCGGARGVDELGKLLADIKNLPCTVMNADWKSHGKSAGMLRNIEMAEYAEALIAIWDGKSKGTKHMISEAKKRGLKVFVLEIDLDFVNLAYNRRVHSLH